MKTLKEVISYLEAIPADNWCTHKFELVSHEGVTKRCVMGHLNHAISGNAVPHIGWTADPEAEPAYNLLKDLGISREELVMWVNNQAPDPKEAVIKYLTEKLKQSA